MLAVGALEGLLVSAFSSALVLNGDHAKGDAIPKAIAHGIVTEMTSSAMVVVPARAGGTYPVTLLSESGMSSKILQQMQGNGINTTNPHCKADIIPQAIAKGVTDAVLALMTVAIPLDGSGAFTLSGISAGAIEAGITAKLASALNLSGPHAKGALIATIAAPVIADYLNSNAVVQGSFVPGGIYPIL